MHSQSLSPQTITTSGDYYTSANAKISWTIGEPITETFSNINNILTQGFQQPLDIEISVKEDPGKLGITVYPNPVPNELTIQWKFQEKFIHVELYDITGKILINEDIENVAGMLNKKSIDMSRYPYAHYLLRVSTPNYEKVKTFKIRAKRIILVILLASRYYTMPTYFICK